MNLQEYCSNIPLSLSPKIQPWEVPEKLSSIISATIDDLTSDYVTKDGVAIHHTATIEPSACIKAPAIIGPECFVGGNTLLRGGVILGDNVSVGPGCEIKSSILCSRAALGHFNFVGDSIIGSGVNLEAGAIIANYHNDREDKAIIINTDGENIATQVLKFGALVGDNAKIGANAVLCPGTVLKPGTIVNRLELVRQS